MSKQKSAYKCLAIGVFSLGLLTLSSKGFAQSAPPTPPPPDEVLNSVGKGLKSINPFKKNKGNTNKSNVNIAPPPAPAGGPPPPPNPLNLFKKKKGGSALPPPPPKPGE